MSEIVHQCDNDRCDLGGRFGPGYFTGGITPEQALALTGDPASPSGPGVCPNCGTPGMPTSSTFAPVIGVDPLDEIHAEGRALSDRIRDPADEMTKEAARPIAREIQDRLEAAHAELTEG